MIPHELNAQLVKAAEELERFLENANELLELLIIKIKADDK